MKIMRKRYVRITGKKGGFGHFKRYYFENRRKRPLVLVLLVSVALTQAGRLPSGWHKQMLAPDTTGPLPALVFMDAKW